MVHETTPAHDRRINARIATRYFPDVEFPARREELVVSAISHGAPLELVTTLRELPKEWYMTPEDLPRLPADAYEESKPSLYSPGDRAASGVKP